MTLSGDLKEPKMILKKGLNLALQAPVLGSLHEEMPEIIWSFGWP